MHTKARAIDYEKLLLKWIKGAQEQLYQIPDRPELLCYGPGSNGWGVQTNQKALAAFAMASTASSFDEQVTGMSVEECRETALAMLKFSLRSHMEGDMTCTNGTKWGHTWISVLGIERMMHGVEVLEPYMTEEDRALLREVLLSESDYLLHHLDIVADVDARTGKNKPESNLWNGALLHRSAHLYPDAPNVAGYREKGTKFLMNSVSILSDLEDEQTIYDGLKLKEHLVGANFFDSYALHHHGYLNVGYMVICLSNAAMLHFMYRKKGEKAPGVLYHHFKSLWQLVKSFTFPDGRLMRIGGDTRVRYTYCQEYLVPTWLMVRDLYGEDEAVRAMEAGWLKQIEHEMAWNGDQTFMSARLQGLSDRSPLYYTRLESDRAACLSMGMAWSELASAMAESGKGDGKKSSEDTRTDSPITPLNTWHDAFHGAYFHSSRTRMASWVWEAAEKPQGLCVPPDRSDMAEWRENLAGHLSGLGRVNGQRAGDNGGALFEGGFITWGETTAYTQLSLAEGTSDNEYLARNQLVCTALPDDTHMIVLQYMTALDRRIFIHRLRGLNLNVPNDLFNGGKRQYYSAEGEHLVTGVDNARKVMQLKSNWLNIDDRIGVLNIYGSDHLIIDRPGQRNIGLKSSPKNGEGEDSLFADLVCGPYHEGTRSVDANEVLLDTGYLIQSGMYHSQTEDYGEDRSLLDRLDVFSTNSKARGVCVKGKDNITYVLLANFGDEQTKVTFPASSEPVDIVTKKPAERVQIQYQAGDRFVDQGTQQGQWAVDIEPGEGKLLRLN